MLNKSLLLSALATLALTGCAQSTTQSDFDCPVVKGVPACLDTYDVDVQGDIPKSVNGVSGDQHDAIEKISDLKLQQELNSDIVTQDSSAYAVKPMVQQPVRQWGSTERMWFAPWEDKTNNLYIDQQYIYWAEQGNWAVSGGYR